MIPGDDTAVIFNVLVADDYEPWRHRIVAEIRKHARWRVIGEATDGVDAVTLAARLEPDLILLDISLPRLNGIDAARRIMADRPDSQILFCSDHHSADIADAAFETGARGYLCKVDAGRDLLFAMEAVVNRGRFRTLGLSGDAVSPRPQRHRHEAGFYSHDVSLVDTYTRFAEAGMAAGKKLIAVEHATYRKALQQNLRGRGFDIDRLITEGRCVMVDAGQLLTQFLADGPINEKTLRAVAGPMIAAAKRESAAGVVACGRVAQLLIEQGRADEAIRLEQLWDTVVAEYGIDMFCGYTMDVPQLASREYAHFQSVCRAHALVYVR